MTIDINIFIIMNGLYIEYIIYFNANCISNINHIISTNGKDYFYSRLLYICQDYQLIYNQKFCKTINLIIYINLINQSVLIN